MMPTVKKMIFQVVTEGHTMTDKEKEKKTKSVDMKSRQNKLRLTI